MSGRSSISTLSLVMSLAAAVRRAVSRVWRLALSSMAAFIISSSSVNVRSVIVSSPRSAIILFVRLLGSWMILTRQSSPCEVVFRRRWFNTASTPCEFVRCSVCYLGLGLVFYRWLETV